MNRAPLQLAVFASGSGSNLEAILQAIESGALDARVALVVSNKNNAGALERASSRNIPAIVLSPDEFVDEAHYTNRITEVLSTHDVNFITLAGYLKKIPASVIQAYQNRILNIHPALLPAFGGPGMYGKHVHRAVIEYGARWSGATVHLVDENYDTGPIVLQKPVPVYQDDAPEDLAARVLSVEHRLYPEALRLFVEGRIQVRGRTVIIDPLIPSAESK